MKNFLKKDWVKNTLYIAMSLAILAFLAVFYKRICLVPGFMVNYFQVFFVLVLSGAALILVVFFPPIAQKRKRINAAVLKARELSKRFVGQKYLLDVFKNELIDTDTKICIADLDDTKIRCVITSNASVTFAPVVIESILCNIEGTIMVNCKVLGCPEERYICTVEYFTFYWAVAHNDVLGTVLAPIDKIKEKVIGHEIKVSLY